MIGQPVVAHVRSRKDVGRALRRTVYGGILGQATLLVTGVVIARALGPSDRGHFALLTLVWAIATSLGGLGIPYALSYFAAQTPNAVPRTVRAVVTPLAIQLALATLVTATVLALLTSGRPGYVQWGAAISTMTVAPWIVQECGMSILQGLHRFGPFNVLRVLPNGGFAVAATALWLAGVRDLLPFAAAWGLSRAVWSPLAVRVARKDAIQASSPGAEPASPSQILAFGRRALFGASPPIEAYRLDQAVVAVFLPPAALGYYVVSLSFTTLPRVLAQSFGFVASPVVASSRTHVAARRAMWRFSWLAALPCVVLSAVLWIVSPALTVLFFGPEFEPSAELTRILLFATALYCLRRVLTDSARGAGYPSIGSVAEVVALIAAVLLLAILVPKWGVAGVGYALIGSSSIALGILSAALLRAGRNSGAPAAWEGKGGNRLD